MAKLLTSVMAGRNDGYMGDYLYRVETCLNLFCDQLDELGLLDLVQIIYIDWGSETPVSESISLGKAARSIVEFLEFDSDSVEAISNGGTSFHMTRAVNIGIRRALGEFIMFADSDCMIPKPSLKHLMSLLAGEYDLPEKLDEIFFYIRRYQIPCEIVDRQPSTNEWRKILLKLASGLNQESAGIECLGGYASVQVAHRKLWYEVGGYDESLDRPWGWSDNDLVFRFSMNYPWVDLGYFGIFGMHMQHWSGLKTLSPREPKTTNLMKINLESNPNGSLWGCLDLSLSSSHSPDVAVSAERELYKPLRGSFKTFDDFLKLFRSEELKDSLNRFININPIDDGEREEITILAGFALEEHPLSFHFIGSLYAWPVIGAASVNPGCDIFFMSPWEGVACAERSSCPPDELARVLASIGYCGYGRVVAGCVERGLEQLKRSALYRSSVELAFVNCTSFGEGVATVIGKLIDSLVSGGCIVLGKPDKKLVDAVNKKLDSSFVFIPFTFGTFVIVKVI